MTPELELVMLGVAEAGVHVLLVGPLDRVTSPVRDRTVVLTRENMVTMLFEAFVFAPVGRIFHDPEGLLDPAFVDKMSVFLT